MPLTEIPELRQFRDTYTYTHEIRRNMVKNSPYWPEATSFQISGLTIGSPSFRQSCFITKAEEISKPADRQLAIFSLAQQLFRNAQPLEGEQLGILNKTSSRLFSKTPTQL